MKVKDLLAKLAMVDQELDIAVVTDVHEYWGTIYGVADTAEVQDGVQVNGPKRPGQKSFVITGY